MTRIQSPLLGALPSSACETGEIVSYRRSVLLLALVQVAFVLRALVVALFGPPGACDLEENAIHGIAAVFGAKLSVYEARTLMDMMLVLL